MSEINNRLARAPVVPLVQASDPDVAVQTATALRDGGLSIIEVVFRTDEALDCLQAVAEQVSGVIAGAGTVLSVDQAEQAISHGAQFLVSPGLDPEIVAVAREAGLPMFPGIMTPSELQLATKLNLSVAKFFPASIAGGVPALKALSSVFRGMKFMPTGGVNINNLAEYLSIPAVIACGGSWLTPATAIERGDYAAISQLATEALAVAKTVRD